MTESSGFDDGIGTERGDHATNGAVDHARPGAIDGGKLIRNGAMARLNDMPPTDLPRPTITDLDLLRERAGGAAGLLRLLANEKRLLVLCHLVGAGEMNVGDLATTVGLSQSALSQHLAKLRLDGLVATRREAQTIYYRLADAKAARLLEVLHELYCREDA